MRATATGTKTILLGTVLAFGCSIFAPLAYAAHPRHSNSAVHPTALHASAAHHNVMARYGKGGHGVLIRTASYKGRHVAHGGGISCVPFARSDSGIELAGNAWQWWDHAAGVYARGEVPEPGSVLAFRANPHMRLGHVAVVSRVINAREVEIDHANWWGPGMRGGVARNMPVVDVSEANDWSAVRVGLGRSGEFGSVYPTYGFIYDRADTGVVMAAVSKPAPQPALNPAPRDLRPVAERPWRTTIEEVAEAPATPVRQTVVVPGTPRYTTASGWSAGSGIGAPDRQ